MMEVIQKYMTQRPNYGRFFIGYKGGNYIKFPVGINTLRAMPKKIVNFLNLPLAQEYSRLWFFRRSSTLH